MSIPWMGGGDSQRAATGISPVAANAFSAAGLPLNQFRSTPPLIPFTRPESECCQNVQPLHPAGILGDDAP